MELELGLGLGLGPSCTTKEAVELRGENRFAKKRRFEEAFEKKTTLPLFIDGSCEGSSDGEVADSRKDDCKELVGWPPFKCSWTKGGSCDDGEQAISYVKVTMEGVLIGRKVDLALHNSYEDLFNTLHQMFPCISHPDGKASSSSNHHHNMVTYKDGDGDWMLIGDLPWEVFVKSVKRIKIVGSSKQEETARNY
ncbi:auxin-responsive protein IAA20-like [Carex rostrata]